MSVCSLLIATLVVAEEMASAHLCVMAKRPAVHARGVQRGLQVTVVSSRSFDSNLRVGSCVPRFGVRRAGVSRRRSFLSPRAESLGRTFL